MFRRTYLVKPAIQLKYMLYGLLGVIATGLCVYLVLDLSLNRAESLSQLSAGELESVREAMRGSLIWVMAVLLVIVAAAGTVLFHRIIGPLYAVEKVLRMVADGDLAVYMPLRRGDELREVAEAVEQMVGGIRRRVLVDKETALACRNKLLRLAEADPALKDKIQPVLAELDRIGQDFRLG
jgi:methyl-accepting chemotaxis protein